MDNWHDASFAKSWDRLANNGNPIRSEQIDLLASILADVADPALPILDLGIGSGQVSESILAALGMHNIVGVDGSAAMLDLCRDRLAKQADRVRLIQHDLCEINDLQLDPQIGSAFSVQTIHNLSHGYQKDIFRWLGRELPTGGWFILIDQIALQEPSIYPAFLSVWNRWQRHYHSSRVPAPTLEAQRTHEENHGDHPATLTQTQTWLNGAGFAAEIVHVHANFAIFAARKIA